MIKHLSRVLALAATVAAFAAAKPAQAQEFKVIVNSANSTSSLPAAVASKLFLKEASKFPDGSPATPVDMNKTSAVRAAFSKAVVGRTVNAVETYWQQQIFSGKDVPPSVKNSDDDVIAFVKSNPGAIGYVSAGASVSGVKVVELK